PAHRRRVPAAPARAPNAARLGLAARSRRRGPRRLARDPGPDARSGVERSLEHCDRVAGDASALDGAALADHLDIDAAGLAHRVALLRTNPGGGHDHALLGEVLADGAAGRAGRRILADAQVGREEARRHGAPRLADLAGEDVEAGDTVLATGGR